MSAGEETKVVDQIELLSKNTKNTRKLCALAASFSTPRKMSRLPGTQDASMLVQQLQDLEELVTSAEQQHPKDMTTSLLDADAQLVTVRMEVFGVKPGTERDKYQARVRELQTRIQNLRRSALTNGRSDKGGGAGSSAGIAAAVAGSFQKSPLSVEAKQQQSLAVLNQAKKQLAETETVGIATVVALDAQGRQINDTKTKMEEVDSGLNRSNKLLNKMSAWWR